jgi:septal ring factor EnvC (AmiA/AmiB activator)
VIRRLLVFPLVFLAANASLVSADSQSDRTRRLAAIRAEAARLEGRLAVLRGRTSTLGGEVERLGLELALGEERMAAAEAEQELAAERLRVAGERARGLEEELAALRARLGRSVFTLYRLGRRGVWSVASSLLRHEDPLPGIRWLRFLGRRDGDALRAARVAAEALAAERREIEMQRAELSRALEEEGRRKRERTALFRRQRALLASAETESRRIGERAAELRADERRLGALLALVAGGADDLGGRPIQEFRGVLDWPAEGAVVAGFGPRLDPRYRTQVPHPGVDIAARPGSPVRAVFAGRVAYAGVFEDYGRMVVLRHPTRALTLYSGLASLRVNKDDVVALAGVLGEASSAPLYFEVRIDARAEDPQRWLAERLQ